MADLSHISDQDLKDAHRRVLMDIERYHYSPTLLSSLNLQRTEIEAEYVKRAHNSNVYDPLKCTVDEIIDLIDELDKAILSYGSSGCDTSKLASQRSEFQKELRRRMES